VEAAPEPASVVNVGADAGDGGAGRLARADRGAEPLFAAAGFGPRTRATTSAPSTTPMAI
jgi:hypothetical protein